MCTLFYSSNSHRKIVHLSHCKVLKRVPKENRRSFKNLKEAQAHGYRLCNCCPSIAQKYRKERSRVKNYCKDHGFAFKLQDGVIHVISKHDCWRMITSGNNNTLFLYHKNTTRRTCKEKIPSIIPGYHSQTYRSKTIFGYLEYINSHDGYRDKHPCTEFTPTKQDKVCDIPSWITEKYGQDYRSFVSLQYKRIKGTKGYRKEQAKKKHQERRAAIIRVNALLDELAFIGY